MLSVKQAQYAAPAISARIVEFMRDGSLAPYVVLENVSTTNSIAVVYQESDDGQNWTDIVATAVMIGPVLSNAQVIVSSKSRLAIKASGNGNLLVSIVKQVNGSPANLGAA